MGVDIRIAFYNMVECNIIAKDEEIFNDRDTEWFNEISGKVSNEAYHFFPITKLNNFSDLDTTGTIKEWLMKNYEEEEFEWEDNYDYCLVSVSEFLEWFENYKPYCKAGWARKYDWYVYKRFGIVPEDVYEYLSFAYTDMKTISEWEFKEYTDPDPSKDIYNMLVDMESRKEIDINSTCILYCFNR